MMRFLLPLFVVLAVAAFHTVLSASLESAEKEEKVTQYDGLTELHKIDQIEFEAAQKEKAAQLNVTEEHGEDTRYLEAVQDESVEEHSDSENESKEQKSAAAGPDESESESSEDTEGRQRREHEETVTEAAGTLEVSQDSSKEQAV